MTARDYAALPDYDNTRIRITISGGRVLSATKMVVHGIPSSRAISVGHARLLFDVIEDSVRNSSFHYRSDFTVDEARYLRSGGIHDAGCRCYFDDDPCPGRRDADGV